MVHKKFILDSFKLLEDGNHIEFLFQLSDNVTLNFNKSRPFIGKSVIKDEIGKIYSLSNRYDHTFINVWEVDDTYTITADLTIKNQNVETKEIPWIAIVKMDHGKIGQIELFTELE